MRRFSLALAALAALAPPASAQDVDLGAPFGTVRLVDEVDCGNADDEHPFQEMPSGASRIETVLGRSARVMTPGASSRFFAYRIGGGAIEPGRAYVLAVDYPEDVPRTMFVANRGGEQIRGFSTGAAIGDARGGYTNNALESIDYPLSGEWEAHRTLFFLHERFAEIRLERGANTRPGTPADGFWVIVAQLSEDDAPLSAGAAVSHIRLYEVPDPDALYATLPYPPEPLPRRHIFWREEMSDNILGVDPNVIGTGDRVTWYEHKVRLMRFLGINTFARDLLEFGHNQGWDSSAYGGNDWVYQSRYNTLWSDLLAMLADYDLYVLPYYEYSGSRGGSMSLGYQRRAEPLGRPPYDEDLGRCSGYTHIDWSEDANVDITDPDTFEDLRRMLEITIVSHRDRAPFAGAWIRNRVSDMPVSFSDATRARFVEEENGGTSVSRADLMGDEALRDRYVAWFHRKRAAFFERVTAYLRGEVGAHMNVLYTPFSEEAGPAVTGGVVADDPARFEGTGVNAQSWDEYVGRNGYLETLRTPHVNWTDPGCTIYEWQHANPPPTMDAYRDGPALVTYPFHRLFSTRAEAIDHFRSSSGELAMVRHFTLNEHRMPDEQLGYFVSDVDRAGPYSMLAEARALAYGDPRFLGYLVSHTFNRGFPEYTRAFNLAFLALPAVPSAIEANAASHADVVVRLYPTESHGTFAAVIHTGLLPVDDVTITLPIEGAITDRVTGAALANGDTIEVDLYPGQVLALHVGAGAPPVATDGGVVLPDGGVLLPDGAVVAPPSEGCSCRMSGRRSSAAPVLLALLGVLAFARRRR